MAAAACLRRLLLLFCPLSLSRPHAYTTTSPHPPPVSRNNHHTHTSLHLHQPPAPTPHLSQQSSIPRSLPAVDQPFPYDNPGLGLGNNPPLELTERLAASARHLRTHFTLKPFPHPLPLSPTPCLFYRFGHATPIAARHSKRPSDLSPCCNLQSTRLNSIQRLSSRP